MASSGTIKLHQAKPAGSGNSTSPLPKEFVGKKAIILTADPALIKELQFNIKAGKKVELATAPDGSKLSVGGKEYPLGSGKERSTHDVFRRVGAKTADKAKAGTRDGVYVGTVEDRLVMGNTTASTDVAAEKLRAQMESAQREKEARSSIVLSQVDKLKASSQRSGHLSPASRSLPGSPALGAIARSPFPGAPTSNPVDTARSAEKSEAVKRMVLHTLAIRPLTAEGLARMLRISKEELLPLLPRWAAEVVDHDSGVRKWELNRKMYEQLDIWAFAPYTKEQRDTAIDRAITAFDKTRLTPTDIKWQKLLPKAERNKGKILSRSKVPGYTESRKSPAALGRPSQLSAEVQRNESSNRSPAGRSTNGRTSPKESDKPKLSEQQAQMKRLLSKKPATTRKVIGQDRAEPKKAAGDSQQKEKKKSTKPAATDTKVKSKEFISSSDEESDHSGEKGSSVTSFTSPQKAAVSPASTTLSQAKSSTSPANPAPAPKPHVSPGLQPATLKIKKRLEPIKTPITGPPKIKVTSSQTVKPSTTRSPALPTKQDTPQRKPIVPSAPRPAAAKADKRPAEEMAPRTRGMEAKEGAAAKEAVATKTAKAAPAKAQVKTPKTNGTLTPVASASKDLKRKAPTDHVDEARSRKQQKTEDDIVTPSTRKNVSAPSESAAKQTPTINGTVNDTHANKSTPVPAAKPSSKESSIDSFDDYSDDSGEPLQLTRRQAFELGVKFRDHYYKQYETFYKQLATSSTPPTDQQRADLMKMHNRIAEMKVQIWGPFLEEGQSVPMYD